MPQVGYWANHFAFRNALDAGETSFGSAGTVEAMEAVVRNTFVQGTLSIVFVTLAIVVLVTSLITTVQALRNGGGENHEDAPVASRRFAPAGLIATPAEKALEREWAELPADRQPESVRH